MDQKNLSVRSYALLAAVILIWGSNWPVMKLALHYITPMWFAVFRLTMGSALLFALAAVKGQLRFPRRADWPVVASVGLLQMGGYLTLVLLGLTAVPAGRSSILAYTTPLWVTPLAFFVLGERPTRRKLVGLSLGLVGILVLFNPQALNWHAKGMILGHGLLLTGALAWAVTIVHVRRHRWQSTALELAPWQMLLGALPLIVLASVIEGPVPHVSWGWPFLLVLAFNGVLATAFCFWAWVTLNRRLPALTLSLASLGVPAVGLLSAVVFLGEPLTASDALGLASISGGVALVILDRSYKKAQEGCVGEG